MSLAGVCPPGRRSGINCYMAKGHSSSAGRLDERNIRTADPSDHQGLCHQEAWAGRCFTANSTCPLRLHPGRTLIPEDDDGLQAQARIPCVDAGGVTSRNPCGIA